MYYIHVVGPYDNTFLGPFTDIEGAATYLRTIDREVFSAYILTRQQFNDNVREFGVAHIQAVLQ